MKVSCIFTLNELKKIVPSLEIEHFKSDNPKVKEALNKLFFNLIKLVKHDKSEQTDINPDDFELDDCLLESNDIVITQNKDGFILHVKKLGNITTAKLSSQDEDQVAAAAVAAATGGHVQQSTAQITEIQEVPDVKPTFTTLTTSPSIKLPSSECGK